MATKEFEKDLIELSRGNTGLGFNIKGGKDQPYLPLETGIFVTKIRDDGAAAKDGRLQLGDKILEINGKDMQDVVHKEAVDIFLSAGEKVSLLVQHGVEEYVREAHRQKVAASQEKETRKFPWFAFSATVAVGVLGVIYYLKYHR
ncbi:synaptojanin-2-binding protein-like [Anneissia japonica]|uniref:synaptojanin-2-binding protein-like n=1 Tax=Anneissia japonica TaxID=1529436 RepID=UPI001425B277|nr:synaptojanin-2-binding protein-like [Anneissia japonica]